MVAPGKNLDFIYVHSYLERTGEDAPQTLAIREHLENWPKAGSTVVGNIKELHLKVEGMDYAVIFSRRVNTVALMAIYEMPLEEALFEERKDYFHALFAQQMKGKRP